MRSRFEIVSLLAGALFLAAYGCAAADDVETPLAGEEAAPASASTPSPLGEAEQALTGAACSAGVTVVGVRAFNGGPGNDNATGTDENDILKGDDCDDTLLGEDGDDTLRGGVGNDELNGGEGNDAMFGGPGNDILTGGCGVSTDVLDGGEGFDQCEGNCERDTFVGCEVVICCQ